MEKDIATLSAFTNAPDRSYEQGILLVFGPSDEERLRQQVARAARQAQEEVLIDTDGTVDLSASWHRIELWLHERPAAAIAAREEVAEERGPRFLASIEKVVGG